MIYVAFAACDPYFLDSYTTDRPDSVMSANHITHTAYLNYICHYSAF
jgi:hypothetical protein